MPAFATVADLSTRLGRSFDEPIETLQVGALLEDASAHLRGLIGADVYPQQTSTIVLHADPRDPNLHVPLSPVIAVTAVEVDGEAVTDYTLVDGVLYRENGWGWFRSSQTRHVPVSVTLTHGYVDPPADLLAWTCVLAAQALSASGDTGTLSAGGVTNLRVDDFSKSWGTDAHAFHVPAHAVDQLRSRYGSSAAVTGARL